ncbi:hypothetical protein V6Z11_A09G087000 [Gossypium hirsutum]
MTVQAQICPTQNQTTLAHNINKFFKKQTLASDLPATLPPASSDSTCKTKTTRKRKRNSKETRKVKKENSKQQIEEGSKINKKKTDYIRGFFRIKNCIEYKKRKSKKKISFKR